MTETTSQSKKVEMSQLLRHQKLMPLDDMTHIESHRSGSLSLTCPSKKVDTVVESDFDILLQKRPGTARTVSDVQRMKEGIHNANIKLDEYMRDVAKRMLPSATQQGCISTSVTPPLSYFNFKRTAEQAGSLQQVNRSSLVNTLFKSKVDVDFNYDSPPSSPLNESPNEKLIELKPSPPPPTAPPRSFKHLE